MADWLNITFAEFDYNILAWFHTLAEKYGDILTPIAKFLDITGDLPLLFIGWFGFALFFIEKNKRRSIWMCGSVIISAILVTIVVKNIVYRTRPYLTEIEDFKVWWEYVKGKAYWDTSFPSGHTSAAMAGVTAFFCASKKKGVAWLFYLYPIILGFSRLYLCVHFPSDVIAGAVVGIIATIVCIPFVNLFYYFFNKYPDNFFSKYCLTGKIK